MASRRIHIVSAGYLRRFARKGNVEVHDLGRDTVRTLGVKGVGYRKDHWGADPAVSDAVEQALSRCEERVLRTLRKVEDHWPLAKPDRPELAQFVAIHIVRTPAFGVFVRRVGAEVVKAESQRDTLTPDELAAAADLMRGPLHQAQLILGQISRVASALSSMHWTLIRFDRDVLITSDQPVVFLSLRESPISPGHVVPMDGVANTVEARFPLDPQHLLLMTWNEQSEGAELVHGTHSQACNVNCSVRAQALDEWFCRPGTAPPFLAPPRLQPEIFPISPEILAGYNVEAAVWSQRRRGAEAVMQSMIQENVSREIVRWVTVRQGSPPAG